LLHVDQASVLEDLEVVGDGLLADSATLGDRTHGRGLVANKAKDLLA
jgi:hypothetical protein